MKIVGLNGELLKEIVFKESNLIFYNVILVFFNGIILNGIELIRIEVNGI